MTEGPVSAMPAFAVKSVEDARPGDEVKIEIETRNNPGIVCFRYIVNYDREHFELVSAQQRDFSGVNFAPVTQDPFLASWFDVSTGGNITTNGVTAELTFRVKEGTPEAVYPVELSYYKQGDVVNFDLQEVNFELQNGSITVGHGEEEVTIPPPREPDTSSQGGWEPTVTLPQEPERPVPDVPNSLGNTGLTFSELEEMIRSQSGLDAITQTGDDSTGSRSGKKKKDSSSGVEALPDPEDALASDDTSLTAEETSTQADDQQSPQAASSKRSDNSSEPDEEKSKVGVIVAAAAAAIVIAAGAVIVLRKKKL